MPSILVDSAFAPFFDAFYPLSVLPYTCQEDIAQHKAMASSIVCRSTLLVDAALLQNSAIQVVATASSGTDHIDTAYLKSHNIALCSAHGSNAHAVADYVIATMALLYKKQVALKNTIGIIGFGPVGQELAYRLHHLGYTVNVCDPYVQVPAPFVHKPIEALIDVDILCIHCNYHQQLPHPSHHLISQRFLDQLNPECIIINASRGNIVDETSLLKSPHIENYCSDVFSNEPNISNEVVKKARIVTPHIAGHSTEFKKNAVYSVAAQLLDHLEYTHPNVLNQEKPLLQTLPALEDNFDSILSLYNPEKESNALKQAGDIRTSFLSIRKSHNTRQRIFKDFRVSP